MRTNVTELFEPAKKEDKQKKLKRWQKYIKDLKETLATGDNAINALKKNSKKKRDTSKITYFNCNNKGYHANTCTEFPKN